MSETDIDLSTLEKEFAEGLEDLEAMLVTEKPKSEKPEEKTESEESEKAETGSNEPKKARKPREKLEPPASPRSQIRQGIKDGQIKRLIHHYAGEDTLISKGVYSTIRSLVSRFIKPLVRGAVDLSDEEQVLPKHVYDSSLEIPLARGLFEEYKEYKQLRAAIDEGDVKLFFAMSSMDTLIKMIGEKHRPGITFHKHSLIYLRYAVERQLSLLVQHTATFIRFTKQRTIKDEYLKAVAHVAYSAQAF